MSNAHTRVSEALDNLQMDPDGSGTIRIGSGDVRLLKSAADFHRGDSLDAVQNDVAWRDAHEILELLDAVVDRMDAARESCLEGSSIGTRSAWRWHTLSDSIRKAVAAVRRSDEIEDELRRNAGHDALPSVQAEKLRDALHEANEQGVPAENLRCFLVEKGIRYWTRADMILAVREQHLYRYADNLTQEESS